MTYQPENSSPYSRSTDENTIHRASTSQARLPFDHDYRAYCHNEQNKRGGAGSLCNPESETLRAEGSPTSSSYHCPHTMQNSSYCYRSSYSPIGHHRSGFNPNNHRFRTRWTGYEFFGYARRDNRPSPRERLPEISRSLSYEGTTASYSSHYGYFSRSDHPRSASPRNAEAQYMSRESCATPIPAARNEDETFYHGHEGNAFIEDDLEIPKPKSTRHRIVEAGELIGALQPLDITCGRGAPTNYHVGNQIFRELVEQYQTAYLCAKRSDKPDIAMKLLDIVKERGGRFVRRKKTAGRFSWETIGDKGAYEKVCQALRDGAPDLRRQMLSTRAINSQNNAGEHEKKRVGDVCSNEEPAKENSSRSNIVPAASLDCKDQCYV